MSKTVQKFLQDSKDASGKYAAWKVADAISKMWDADMEMLCQEIDHLMKIKETAEEYITQIKVDMEEL